MLPLARYRFTFRMHEPARLPELAGSALRGVFGYALRQLARMTKTKKAVGYGAMGEDPQKKSAREDQRSRTEAATLLEETIKWGVSKKGKDRLKEAVKQLNGNTA